MTAGDLVEVPDAPEGELYYTDAPQAHEHAEEYARASSQGPSLPNAPPIPLIEVPAAQPGQVVVTDQTPVFSGPIYNLDSTENLPARVSLGLGGTETLRGLRVGVFSGQCVGQRCWLRGSLLFGSSDGTCVLFRIFMIPNSKGLGEFFIFES